MILVLLSQDCLCYNVQQAIDTALDKPSPTTETADDKPPPPTLETMHNEIMTEAVILHKKVIDVHHFSAGMAIEVRFITPNGGRPTLDLKDAAGNIMLHVNPRWDKRAFVLNSYISGSWGKEERPGEFDFSVGVPMSIRVEAHSSFFKII